MEKFAFMITGAVSFDMLIYLINILAIIDLETNNISSRCIHKSKYAFMADR